MRAESIEQIREHLARGGKVTSINQLMETCEAISVTGNVDWIQVKCTSGHYKGASAAWRFHRYEWELLPIEEEKVDGDDSKLKPCPFCGGDAEAMTYCGNDTIFCQTCPAMMGGEESKATREELAEAWNRRPSEEGEDDQSHVHYWLEFMKDTCENDGACLVQSSVGNMCKPCGDITCRYQRIRQFLLFGHYPAMNDLIAWWQATTGERIERGRRCEKCGGEGVQTLAFYGRGVEEPIMSQPCPACKDHPGYTVRPTWMGEVKG